MHDEVLESAGAAARCPARGPSGELRVALPSAEAITTLGAARAAIDDLDAALATLLEHRAAVAAVVQRLKPVGGFAAATPAGSGGSSRPWRSARRPSAPAGSPPS
ncbi:hypothetical protein [Actinomadura madurae]|uniref:hypothetical protein n=1 Tax=Actinomadura madurae TaxID=1993 RepID=UPI0035583E40